jgi:hypothetical protein
MREKNTMVGKPIERDLLNKYFVLGPVWIVVIEVE